MNRQKKANPTKILYKPTFRKRKKKMCPEKSRVWVCKLVCTEQNEISPTAIS